MQSPPCPALTCAWADAEEIPGAAEDEAPAEPSAPDRSPSATLRQENAAAGSGDTADVPALAQPGRGSENLAHEDRIQLSKNGLKNGNSPPSSLSLHPTSSDSDEELAMGQRMQQLPRSPSAVCLQRAQRLYSRDTARKAVSRCMPSRPFRWPTPSLSTFLRD